MDEATREFQDLRPLMFSIAYRMVSGVVDAEDIIQEAFLRYQRALFGQISELGVTMRCEEINGQPGVVFRDPAGRLITVFSLEIADGVVQTVRSVINPDKLRHWGQPADLADLLRERRSARPRGTAQPGGPARRVREGPKGEGSVRAEAR